MNNLSTIIVGLIVLTIIIFIIAKLIRDKKQGKTSCGCNCKGCPNSAFCHSEDSQT